MRNKVYNYLTLSQKYFICKFINEYKKFISEVCHYVVYHMNHLNPRHWEACVKTQHGGKRSNQNVTLVRFFVFCLYNGCSLFSGKTKTASPSQREYPRSLTPSHMRPSKYSRLNLIYCLCQVYLKTTACFPV